MFDEKWTDEEVYHKGFWLIVMKNYKTPPAWFVLRYIKIADTYDKEILEKWALGAVKKFLDWCDDDA